MYDPQTSHHNDHLRCFELWKHVFLYHYTTWNFGYSLKQIPTHNKIVSSIVSQEVNIAGKSRNKLNRLLVPGWLSSCHTGTRDRLQISHALTHAHTAVVVVAMLVMAGESAICLASLYSFLYICVSFGACTHPHLLIWWCLHSCWLQ